MSTYLVPSILSSTLPRSLAPDEVSRQRLALRYVTWVDCRVVVLTLTPDLLLVRFCRKLVRRPTLFFQLTAQLSHPRTVMIIPLFFLSFHLLIFYLVFFQLCETYPQQLFVPRSASTHVLMGSASFRSKARMPVLSYLHRQNQVSAHIPISMFCRDVTAATSAFHSLFDVIVFCDRRQSVDAVSLWRDLARVARRTKRCYSQYEIPTLNLLSCTSSTLDPR